MPRRLTVVLSQGQSLNPAKRKLEEDIVAQLVVEGGVEVTVIPNLYDLAPDGTGVLALQGITGDMVVLAWLYPRAAHWTLDRHGIRGTVGTTLINSDDQDEEEEDASTEPDSSHDENGKSRVADGRPAPNRTIYCLDLRARNDAASFIAEIRRIAAEASVQTVGLMNWINGTPRPEQLSRYLNPTAPSEDQVANPESAKGVPGPVDSAPIRIDESPNRRWYPVIDYSRCTNCMECIDFCLFGVYGVDRAETILVEQPDNCRKGCPACSRVCPENAIIFPQHKTPAIAGSAEAAGGLKIDLSALFGGGSGQDALTTAVSERDEQLLLAGREAVGTTVGVAKRQQGKPQGPKDELDHLIDALDDLSL
jgi:NAD-dependent dihydropyrimidine dehydrogenase PreA subunit